MVKYQFGKNWNWFTELKSIDQITNKHLDIAYRIDSNICQIGKCKTNCNTNPYCLNGLGEKKLTNLLQKDSTVTVERNEFFRNKDEYAGLVNLGATCYINTYLQVWFNNKVFRDAFLNQKFNDDENTESLPDDQFPALTNGEFKFDKDDRLPDLKYPPSKSIAFNLQLIFYLLKESIRKSIDPNFFIKALGLDENMQQDAQEFSQLFLTSLENKLPKLKNGHDMIKCLFEGQYSYITECSFCKRQSVRNSSFLELSLNIQNCSTLTECIDDLLKEEMMDGDNQYYCDDCSSKRNAKRFTKLTELPPVLNLQLLRFVYDRNSGVKKNYQIKSKILDLNSYKSDENTLMAQENEAAASTPDNSSVYHLGAILMHVGKSAYSGHYMAQIKNFETNEWFSFNDEAINKIKKKQQLGCTDDEIEKQKNSKQGENIELSNNSENSSQSQTPPVKGNENLRNHKIFSTSNAYLLVYYRKDFVSSKNFLENQDVESKPSERIQKIVDNDNKMLETWFQELKETKLGLKETQNTERTMVRSIYDSLWCNNDTKNDSYFIRTDFIRKLLSSQTSNINLSTDTTAKYLCTHKHLNPFAINRFKLISKEGLDSILSNYPFKLDELGVFEAHNNETTRCLQCVINIYEYLKIKDKIKDDGKLLRSLLKFYDLNADNDSESEKIKYSNGNGNGHANDEIIFLDNENKIDNNNTDSDINPASPNSYLNDISAKRYWIGKESIKVWNSLAIKKYESQLPPVKFNDIEVIDLTNGTNNATNEIVINQNGEVTNNNDSNEASNDKTTSQSNNAENDTDSMQISFGFNEDILCNHGSLAPTQNKRLVSNDVFNFFQAYFPTMKQFSSDVIECKKCKMSNEQYLMKTNEVKSQKEILSDIYHNRNRPNLMDYPNESILYVVMIDFIKEWRSMIKNSKYKNIEMRNTILFCEHQKLPFNEKTFDNTLGYLVTSNEWDFLSKNYKHDQAIIIQKVDAETIIFEPDVCEQCFQQNEMNKLLYEDKKIFIRQKNDDTETEVVNRDDCEIINSNPKKMKLNENDDYANGPISPVNNKYQASLRRSKRSRKCKGDLEVIVSSYSTVKDVKVQITGLTNKLVSEQHLFFNNIELENDLTMINYKINPSDVLTLKFDKNTNDDFDNVNYELAHMPEIGFKGTNLYG